MPDTTTRLGLALSELDDTADYPAATNPNLERIDDLVALDDQGTLAERPPASPALRGAYYLVTDLAIEPLFRCNGTAWKLVTSKPIIATQSTSVSGSASNGGRTTVPLGVSITLPLGGRWSWHVEGYVLVGVNGSAQVWMTSQGYGNNQLLAAHVGGTSSAVGVATFARTYPSDIAAKDFTMTPVVAVDAPVGQTASAFVDGVHLSATYLGPA